MLWKSLLGVYLGILQFVAAHADIDSDSDGVVVKARDGPDLHMYDSRCNPLNTWEIQRFDGQSWIHHFTCRTNWTCKDVNGIGACQVAPGVYVLKAANDSTIIDPVDLAPLIPEKKCNPYNSSETLWWNSSHWIFDGVCVPPYVCHDFGGQAGFAFCSHPNVINKQIWLPWPSLTAPPSKVANPPDAYTRCASSSRLEKWNGESWQLYRTCDKGWQCQTHPHHPHMGGCAATSYADVVPTRHSTTNLRRGQPPTGSGLIQDGQGIIYQGEQLVQEGNDLIEDGKENFDHVYGVPESEVEGNKQSWKPFNTPKPDTVDDTDTDDTDWSPFQFEVPGQKVRREESDPEILRSKNEFLLRKCIDVIDTAKLGSENYINTPFDFDDKNPLSQSEVPGQKVHRGEPAWFPKDLESCNRQAKFMKELIDSYLEFENMNS